MNMGSLGIPECLIISCVCLVPVAIAVGVVIALLVVRGRRKPKAESREEAPQAPAPAAPREPAARPGPSLASKPVVKSCSSCGADNPADNAFCEYCGASLAEK